jgi:hypothetical protein
VTNRRRPAARKRAGWTWVRLPENWPLSLSVVLPDGRLNSLVAGSNFCGTGAVKGSVGSKPISLAGSVLKLVRPKNF